MHGRAAAMLSAPISPGELLDKITILRIKYRRLSDPEKRNNVQTELTLLEEIWRNASFEGVDEKISELQKINEKLWDIEDTLRVMEARKNFGESFIGAARSVYYTNDRRAEIKKEINLLLKAEIIEEKSYQRY